MLSAYAWYTGYIDAGTFLFPVHTIELSQRDPLASRLSLQSPKELSPIGTYTLRGKYLIMGR